MKLGAFSLSLSVKNIGKSRAFYEALGFEKFHGEEDDNWLIMKNGDTVIGLFQGMFEKNTLTFNPRWNNNAEAVDGPDIREIQKDLVNKGVKFVARADESTSGPDSFIVLDPDGNPILVDQHV